MNLSAYIPDRANDARLAALYNRHCGQRCFIVGNGPSLRISDLDRLRGEITFASNRIFLAFDQTTWRPTYYTMCDVVVARENQEAVRALSLQKIFAGSVRAYFRDVPEAVFVNLPRLREEKQGILDARGIPRLKRGALHKLISSMGRRLDRDSAAGALRRDVSWPVGWNLLRGARAGHSVINLGLKAAYWMGIREAYVIGCDHNFTVPQTQTGERIYQNAVILSQGEQNHFHPEYRRPGDKWTFPQLDIIADEFSQARRVFEADGGRIVNASRKTCLEAWERADFDGLFPVTDNTDSNDKDARV